MPVMTHMTGNIIFIGLMGSGKTTQGRLLARHLRRPFFDADHYLVEKTGVSIPTIFELEGEEGFRERESQVIAELTQKERCVLATGGGAVLRESNREAIRRGGWVIYLHALPQVLYERTRFDKNRPLLQVADPLSSLQELYRLRDPLYRQTADVVLDLTSASSSQQLQKIINSLPETLVPSL